MSPTTFFQDEGDVNLVRFVVEAGGVHHHVCPKAKALLALGFTVGLTREFVRPELVALVGPKTVSHRHQHHRAP